MSEEHDDLELQALQRQLDDAFATTRPRAGFEDELWARMQERRPARSRFRDAFGGFWPGIRAVPALPLAGVAALVVVVIGIGIVGYGGLGHRGSSPATDQSQRNAPGAAEFTVGYFGKLPTPVFVRAGGGQLSANPTTAYAGAAPAEYDGPVQLTWSGQLNVTIASAPVFRYREPTTATADQFASALGAALRSRPGGFLGSYGTADYTLEVRGTVQTPPQSPAYFIFSSPSMAPVQAAGASPQDLASLFLAEHSLTPQWNYATVTDTTASTTRVIFQRQFVTPGYGTASLIDYQGQRYGLEVDMNGNQVVHVSGLLPVDLDEAMYPIINSDAAIRSAMAAGTPVPVTTTAAPSVKLTQGELAYLLVPAGDHSFYEPVYLFSGTFQLNGTTYVKHVVVPAVDPQQRQP